MTPFAAAWTIAVLLQSPAPAPAGQPIDAISRARVVMESIQANDFAKVEVQFNGAMKAAMPPGRLAAMWTRLLFQSSAYKRCGTPRDQPVGRRRPYVGAAVQGSGSCRSRCERPQRLTPSTSGSSARPFGVSE
jgi:hypothetical protein